MNVLIDTNIILDILLRREPYCENAAKINVLSENGYINCFISASSVTDIFYIMKKSLKDNNIVVLLIQNILKTVTIASVTENEICKALNLDWNDFEDAVQYITAQNISAEYIITRNPKDFIGSMIKIATPEEFLDELLNLKI